MPGPRVSQRLPQFAAVNGVTDGGPSSSTAETTTMKTKSRPSRGSGKLVEDKDEKAEAFNPGAKEKHSAMLNSENMANFMTMATNRQVDKFAKEHITGGWRPGMDP